jgi:Protein of unknown function (DUF3025)
MSAPGFGIDWSAPWFAPWRLVGQQVADAIAGGLALPEALNTQRCQIEIANVPRFVAQDALPAGVAYERYVAETGCCPTRDNLHDFFNGLAWLRFPLIKQRLNRLQAEQITAQGVGGTRGAVRDALTLFDENAAFLHASPALWEALRAQQWRRVFVELRAQWSSAQLVVFGHAALEKLVQPRKPITVHVYCPQVRAIPNFFPEIDSIAQLDDELSQSLEANALATKPFTPLPVLGVPGWWGENADFSFYDDASVFRPRKTP